MKQARFPWITMGLLVLVLVTAFAWLNAWVAVKVQCCCALGGDYSMDACQPEDCYVHGRDAQ